MFPREKMISQQIISSSSGNSPLNILVEANEAIKKATEGKAWLNVIIGKQTKGDQRLVESYATCVIAGRKWREKLLKVSNIHGYPALASIENINIITNEKAREYLARVHIAGGEFESDFALNAIIKNDIQMIRFVNNLISLEPVLEIIDTIIFVDSNKTSDYWGNE